MDAREQLRRYLEQRRETGERELILDGMSVEDVMRIIGAPAPPATTPTRSGERVENHPAERAQERAPTPAPQVPTRDESSEAAPVGDWRDVLRATGSAPSRQSAP